MNCEQAEELLGAYALDALPDEEATQMRAHLATCAEHAAKARELRVVASALAETVEPMVPPRALRGRIAAAVASAGEQTTDNRQQILHDPPVALAHGRARPDGARARVQWRPSYAWGAIAAGLLIAVAGLLAWNISLRSDGGATDVLAVKPLLQDTGATAGYVVLLEGDRASIVGEALPRLEPAKAYQLWSISTAGEATSLGLMEYDDAGVAVADVSFDPSGTTAVAITIERAGGVEQPTSAPVYSARL
ncbi:MAG: anti-sigma factor [Chloroflexi bacterium]|nr:anti-sigma factor [Chloroflexota bacterium]